MKDDPQLQQTDLPIWLALKYKFERFNVSTTPCRPSAVHPRDQDDPHDDAHQEGGNSAKRQMTTTHGMFELRGSSSGQDYESELGPSTSGNQEQVDDFDFCINSYDIDDDVIPNEKVSQELVDEISQTVNEAKLRKVSDIVWESRKEILVLPFQPKPTLVVQSCQRDSKAHGLPLVNQDLLYLKKGNSGPEKIVLSLHKFPAVIYPDDDIEERTFRWVDKCVKRFNPYARYGVEHWKNPHAKIFYIKKQQEPGKPKEEIYSNSKIVQIIKTYWELGHEHKFITEIIAKRANGSIMSITESDYKNLNKNDTKDMYMLIINHKVNDYAETGLLWSLSVFIRSTMIWERVHDFQLGLKSYNNDVKHGYVTPSLSHEDVKYLQLFEEDIEERLKHRDQIRHWEMYVNGRPLGSRREHPE
ncbi:hypothetical protein Tco_0532078 [Tanacetum coccineum]